MPDSVIPSPILHPCDLNFDASCGDYPYDPGPVGCFDPWDPFCGYGPPIIIITPPPIIIENPQTPGVSPADLAKAINTANSYTTGLITGVKNIAIAIGRALAGALALAATLWAVLKPVLKAIQGILAKFKRWLDKILKPILDAQRRQIAAILDLYRRFIRPLIIFIEQVRRVIHILQLFHIHVLDGLDRQLAKIEGKILRPFYALLYRVNTLGNWVSFILNAKALIFRGLFLGSLQANQFGAFNLLAGAPNYGPPVELDKTAGGVDAPVTVDSLRAGLAVGFDEILRTVDKETGDVLRCFRNSITSMSFEPGSLEHDTWVCLKRSVGE